MRDYWRTFAGHTPVIDNYVRGARFVKVIDGDTFAAVIALAPKVKPAPLLDAHVRVFGWNAAELREAEGPAMRDAFNELLQAARVITVQMVAMSFERIVCVVYLDGVRFDGLLDNRLRIWRTRAANS